MRLGEALGLAADLRQEIRQMEGRIAAAARYQDGGEPLEDVNTLMTETEDKVGELADLTRRIYRTNSATEIEPGTTISEALAWRDHLGLLRSVVARAADAGSPDRYEAMRRTRTELVTKTDLPVQSLRTRESALAKERRVLDARIQQADWAVDLLD